MKNGMKKTAAVVMAAMLMGTGAVVPAAEDMGYSHRRLSLRKRGVLAR